MKNLPIFLLIFFCLFVYSCTELQIINEGFFIIRLKSGEVIQCKKYREHEVAIFISDIEISKQIIARIDTIGIGTIDSSYYENGYKQGQIDATNNIYKWKKVLQDNGEIKYQRIQ